jgi:hypothetical protein
LLYVFPVDENRKALLPGLFSLWQRQIGVTARPRPSPFDSLGIRTKRVADLSISPGSYLKFPKFAEVFGPRIFVRNLRRENHNAGWQIASVEKRIALIRFDAQISLPPSKLTLNFTRLLG